MRLRATTTSTATSIIATAPFGRTTFGSRLATGFRTRFRTTFFRTAPFGATLRGASFRTRFDARRFGGRGTSNVA
ncbi:hypothetical protein D3C83_197980 [compost metagenome]